MTVATGSLLVARTTMEPNSTTESAAEIATKVYTLYFLVAGIILGLLLFIGVRKSVKICCWRCMYGSKYIKDEKADPRVPKSLFRTPSVLSTLQSHYDRRPSGTSAVTSGTYEKPGDEETGTLRDSYRVRRYLEEGEYGGSQSTARTGTLERVRFASDILRAPSDSSTLKSVERKRRSTLSQDDDRGDFLETDEDQPAIDSAVDVTGSKDSIIRGANQFSAGSLDDTASTYQPVVVQLQSLTSDKQDTIGKYSSISELSTTDDGAPLVNMDTAAGYKSSSILSNKKGRYKKNMSLASSPGVSFASASAKSSKRTSKSFD